MFYPYTKEELKKILTDELNRHINNQNFKDIRLNLIEYQPINEVISVIKGVLKQEHEISKTREIAALTQQAHESQTLEDNQEEYSDKDEELQDKQLSHHYSIELGITESQVIQKEHELSQIDLILFQLESDKRLLDQKHRRIHQRQINNHSIVIPNPPGAIVNNDPVIIIPNSSNSIHNNIELNRVNIQLQIRRYQKEQYKIREQIKELRTRKEESTTWLTTTQHQNLITRGHRQLEREKRRLIKGLSSKNQLSLSAAINQKSMRLDEIYQEHIRFITQNSYSTYLSQIKENLNNLSLSLSEKQILKEISTLMNQYMNFKNKMDENEENLKQNRVQRQFEQEELDRKKKRLSEIPVDNHKLHIEINALKQRNNELQSLIKSRQDLRFIGIISSGFSGPAAVIVWMINPVLIFPVSLFLAVCVASLSFIAVLSYLKWSAEKELSTNEKSILNKEDAIKSNDDSYLELETQQKNLDHNQKYLDVVNYRLEGEFKRNNIEADKLLEQVKKIGSETDSTLVNQSIFKPASETIQGLDNKTDLNTGSIFDSIPRCRVP